MKKWVQKLIDQLDFDWPHHSNDQDPHQQPTISEERATLAYVIDTYNKNLLEVASHPVRKVRATLDEFAKEILNPNNPQVDRTLARFRQFFSSYRIDEYTYIQRTMEEFRSIIWDFVDQLSEDLEEEQVEDQEIWGSLEELRDAVEANSIDLLRVQSRQFIDTYTEYQTKRENRRSERFESVKKNLTVVKKQLTEANQSMRLDHLTQAYNRKSFDEQLQQHWRFHQVSQQTPVSLLTLDIDHFKKVNDNYGHPIGDFLLVECVRLLHEHFNQGEDFVARIGGEEFAVILPECDQETAAQRTDDFQQRVRKEVFVSEGLKLQFTVSAGIAQLVPNEELESWMKRSDEALYHSKNSGRDRLTVAPSPKDSSKVA